MRYGVLILLFALAACQSTGGRNETFKDAWEDHSYDPATPGYDSPQRVKIYKEYGNDSPDADDE
jgi:hypothetical protein